MQFHYPPGATPYNADDTDNLLPQHITRQSELNEWEQANIINAEVWVFAKKLTYQTILTLRFVQRLHKKMFGETWRWAGAFRQTETTIGTAPYTITTELTNLLADVLYQINHQTYSPDELAWRFHHRLVKIHPFPNGNGRHARLITDLLLLSLDQTRFSWGNAQLTQAGETRNDYISALKLADKGDYKALAQFVRM